LNSITLTENQTAQLRGEMKHSPNVQVYRRATALLAVHGGQSVIQVAELLGVTRQSIYNWIATYGRPDENLDLRDAPRAGRPPLVTEELQGLLAAAFRQAPAELGYPAENWTASLLREHLCAQGGRQLSDETLRRHLGRLGYVWKDRRYVLERKDGTAETRPATEDALC
jgi:transposase